MATTIPFPRVCVENTCGENGEMSGADWRSENAYQDVRKAEAADIAWEWLRRDREYQKDFSALIKRGRSGSSDHFRRKWGLTFRS
ncbi:transcriptional regulator domain-containing protein [Bradyrhizobium embrapense]|uniref:transcriptional regulator domain-containing protein n=1 Tax=Bradyrhizobium embrapense TaxID=630921 RepID=UPI003D315AB9